MKKKSIIAIAILALLGIFGYIGTSIIYGYEDQDESITTMYIHVNYLRYDCIEDMASSSTCVVRAKVLDIRTEMINIAARGEGIEPIYFPYTVYTVEVIESFKGEAVTGDIIEVKQIGGIVGNIHATSHHKIHIYIGDDLVLFLFSNDTENMPSNLINAAQGVYRFTPSNENARGRNLNDELEIVGEQNDLTLTLDDLRRISEGEIE